MHGAVEMLRYLGLLVLSLHLLNGLPLDEKLNDHKLRALAQEYIKNNDATVDRIQRNLISHPSGQKFTRGEIVNILDDLSSEELDDAKQRRSYQRALMLVMPYTPKDSSHFNMEDLYTKPPVTRLVDVKLTAATTARVTSASPARPAATVQTTSPSTTTEEDSGAFLPTVRTDAASRLQAPPAKKFPNHRYPAELQLTQPTQKPTTLQMFSDFVPMTASPAALPVGYATSLPIDVDVPQQPKFSSQYDGSRPTFPKPSRPHSTSSTSTSTTSVPDISEMADSLSPDMRELLASFGLLDLGSAGPSERAEPFRADLQPLSTAPPETDEMDRLLASFGLGAGRQRALRNLNGPADHAAPDHVPRIDKDLLPDSMHAVLEDIGLAAGGAEPDASHVFRPAEAVVQEDEMNRLAHLLDTIRRLEKLNRTIVQDDLADLDIANIKSLSKVLGGTRGDLGAPPDLDPINFDLGIERNQVKRQENTTTPTPTTMSAETTQSFEALAESFGGGPVSKTTTETSLPAPRKTGFYYLVDWNSFLEVGEEGKDRVNIRFSPQAGDPSRFYRV